MGAMRAAGLLWTALALVACQKTDDGGAKPNPYGEKAAAQAKGPAPAPVQQARLVTPGGEGAPTSQPTSQPTGGMPAGHPPTGGMPAGHPPTGMGGGDAAPAGAGGALAGTISLASGLENRIPAGAVLYVIVRRDAGEGNRGMLLAATKHPITPKSFPFSYLVTSANVMMQGTELAGPVRIEARIDQDGDAMSKQPGDIVGQLNQVVNVGAKGADFSLDQTL